MSRAYIALHYNKLKHHTLGMKMEFNVLKQIFLTTQDDIYLLLLHSIRIIYHKKTHGNSNGIKARNDPDTIEHFDLRLCSVLAKSHLV